jgi:hypothetical protein
VSLHRVQRSDAGELQLLAAHIEGGLVSRWFVELLWDILSCNEVGERVGVVVVALTEPWVSDEG